MGNAQDAPSFNQARPSTSGSYVESDSIQVGGGGGGGGEGSQASQVGKGGGGGGRKSQASQVGLRGEGEPNRKAARREQKSYVGTSYDNREPCVVPVVEKESDVCHAFQVEPGIKVGGDYARRGVDLVEAWESLGTVEAMSAEPRGAKTFFTSQNMFAKCVNDAFFGHYGLRLSPDVVWQTIL